ncbi:ABC transporter permease [Brachybacterium alimentarium]|uniref:ABC transporter permease n=1 Tax=Brachybacterium alimentarium TaxID=47845 RepID=A0A2A3YMF5_9MICO|nr:hypothetical protein CIK66_03685 [Brachybacterium alimentarium]RCS82016.1 hypothetical protein CIK72_05355 [Brachybacterium alimentarium]
MTELTSTVHDGLPPRLRHCVAGEAVKALRNRSTALILLVALGISIIVSVLVSAFNSGHPNPVSVSLIGPFLGVWPLVVLASTLVTMEYSTGMIQHSLAITPSRLRFLTAKLLLVVAVSVVAGTVVAFASFGVSQLVLGAADMPTADLTDPETFRAVTVTGLFAVVYPLISACLAFMTRHAAAAMLLTLVVAFFPLVMGELGSSWWAEVAVRFAPGGPMESLTGQAIPGTVGYLSPALAVLVTVVWLGLFVAAAIISDSRRDA